MIRLMSDLPENTIGIVASGRVSADDYESAGRNVAYSLRHPEIQGFI